MLAISGCPEAQVGVGSGSLHTDTSPCCALKEDGTLACWAEGPSDDPRAGAPLLGGKAGRAGAAQPGEEKDKGRP